MADSDRHKTPRVYKSGSDKRKLASTKKSRINETLAKVPKISNMFKKSSTTIEGTSVQSDEKTNIEAVSSENLEDDGEGKNEELGDIVSRGDEEVVTIYMKDQGDGDEELEKVSKPVQEIVCSEMAQHDIGEWPKYLSNDFIEYWIKRDMKNLHNCDSFLFEQKSCKQKEVSIKYV